MGQISSAEVRTLVHSTAHTLRKHKQACRGKLSKIEQGGLKNPLRLRRWMSLGLNGGNGKHSPHRFKLAVTESMIF